MPVKKTSDKGKRREPRRFPPSLAGGCLRYAVMEVLGFGRLIEPESQAAMRAGSAQHKVFQAHLQEQYAMCSVEVLLKDNAWGVSGRMDAILETPGGPLVVEYKTVSPDRFERIRQHGPLIAHWAQLQLYLAVSGISRGALVVDRRETPGRMVFQTEGDPVWSGWLRDRIDRVKEYQSARKLPPREVSAECAGCDRWQRCFRGSEERDLQIAAHPEWEPEPMIPAPAAFMQSEDIVS